MIHKKSNNYNNKHLVWVICLRTHKHAWLGEVHLGSPPQDDSFCGEGVCDDTEYHQEDGHWHHNHIMADAGSNVQPAAIVLHQEEKMQSHYVRDDQDDEE